MRTINHSFIQAKPQNEPYFIDSARHSSGCQTQVEPKRDSSCFQGVSNSNGRAKNNEVSKPVMKFNVIISSRNKNEVV